MQMHFFGSGAQIQSTFMRYFGHCRLFGASFDELNDIDEGRFVFSQELLNRIGKIRSDKEKLRICCFSLEDKLCLDLIWAHYGNAYCGVKIDFEIDCSQDTIK